MYKKYNLMNNLTAIMRYMQNLDALAETVSGEMKRQNLNTYEVADRARTRGFKIVHGTVWNVINKQVKEVKDKTIVAISQGLGLPEENLFAIVRGLNLNDESVENGRFQRIAQGYVRLSEAEKQNLEPFLRAIEQTIEKALPAKISGSTKKNVADQKAKRKGKKSFTTGDGRNLRLVEGTSGSDDEND